MKRAIVASLAGLLAISVVAPASAAPVTTQTAAVRAAAPDHTMDVRWRGRGIGPGLAFGLAAGALVGAAVAAQPYYGPGYYYAEPGYAPGYVYDAPVYAVPAPSYRYGGWGSSCYTDEGYGRYQPCVR